jgi:hypothetical protein
MSWQRQAVSLMVALAGTAVPVAWAQQTFTVPAGTRLPFVFETAVSSASSHVGDPVRARTTRNVRSAGGAIMIPAGSVLHGHVTAADPGGKMKGRAHVAVRFDRVVVRGEEHALVAASVGSTARSMAKRDAAQIAGGTIGGAVVGGILGGKKGARIGAVAGGAAGTGAAVSTRGPQVGFSSGYRSTVRLTRASACRVL